MPKLQANLSLKRCPHCSVASPLITKKHSLATNNYAGTNRRMWFIYVCTSCGGVVTACALNEGYPVLDYFPKSPEIDEDLPAKAKAYLEQAVASINAPAGAVMLAASAVDAMLKEREYTKGTLYSRIEQAGADHLITGEMAKWAHEVRLDANEQRHADVQSELPNDKDAKRVIDFAHALAQFLFVLPARVKRGIAPKEAG